MSFGAPHWLWALGLLPALVLLFILHARRNRALLHRIIAPRLASQLAASVSWPKRWLRFLLQLAALAAVITALAQPRLGFTWEESKRKGRDVLLVLDVSKSMLSTDAAPNRLTRAKLAAEDLTNLLNGDRVGVIAFAGDAFLQAPLTADAGAVLDSIRELDTNIIPVGGTNIAEALRIANTAFGKGEGDHRALVLFSDGEEIEADAVEAARKQKDSFRVFTVGVGTRGGSLIPLPGSSGGTTFVKDEHGQFVKSRLDEERLRKLAEVSGGFYVHLENGAADMKKIVNEGLQKMAERDLDAKSSRHPIERYQWPLGLGLALLSISLFVNDRRRAAGRAVVKIARPVAVAAAILFSAQPRPLFGRSAGVELYGQQKFKESGEAFQKELARLGDSAALQYDLGTAAYKLADYEKALESFSKALAAADAKLQPKSEYNLGNTLYQIGAGKKEKEAKAREWRSALEHYEQALKLEPKNDDAKHNRETVRRLIEELEKQQREEKKQEQEKPQPSPKPESKDQQKKDEQQSKEQQDQQEKDGDEKSKPDSKPQSQEGKNQEQKKQPGDDKSEAQKQQDGKEKGEQQSGEQKPEKPSPGEQRVGDGKNQVPSGAPPEKPNPADVPPPSDKKFSGDVQAAKPQEPGEKEQPAEVAEGEVKEGEMSKGQAMSLLESLKGDDERVTLTERKRATRVGKDW